MGDYQRILTVVWFFFFFVFASELNQTNHSHSAKGQMSDFVGLVISLNCKLKSEWTIDRVIIRVRILQVDVTAQVGYRFSLTGTL